MVVKVIGSVKARKPTKLLPIITFTRSRRVKHPPKNLTMSVDGNDKRAKVPRLGLNPLEPALQAPYKYWMEKGLIKFCVTFESGSIQTKACLSANVCAKIGLPVEGGYSCWMPSGIAANHLRDSGFADNKKKGAETRTQPKPAQSLTLDDCKSAEVLKERIILVTQSLGASKISGRIGSMRMSKPKKATFSAWVDAATPVEVMSLLSDKKHRSAIREALAGDKDMLNMVVKVIGSVKARLPFRDEAVPQDEESGVTATASKKAEAPRSRAASPARSTKEVGAPVVKDKPSTPSKGGASTTPEKGGKPLAPVVRSAAASPTPKGKGSAGAHN
jgi:hypothetical protein